MATLPPGPKPGDRFRLEPDDGTRVELDPDVNLGDGDDHPWRIVWPDGGWDYYPASHVEALPGELAPDGRAGA